MSQFSVLNKAMIHLLILYELNCQGTFSNTSSWREKNTKLGLQLMSQQSTLHLLQHAMNKLQLMLQFKDTCLKCVSVSLMYCGLVIRLSSNMLIQRSCCALAFNRCLVQTLNGIPAILWYVVFLSPSMQMLKQYLAQAKTASFQVIFTLPSYDPITHDNWLAVT